MAKSQKRNPTDDEEEISDDEDEDYEGGEEDDEGGSSPERDRKKRKQSSFLDVAASEDDDEDDDEDDEAGAGGRRRGAKRNRFIDDIAAVDEEEDEEDEEEEVDDLIGDEADEVADQQELQQVYRQVQRADDDINPEELEKYIKERFERPAYASGDVNEQAGMVSQQGLLPTHQDPKLWLVETRTGQEREACIRLMQKSIDLARSGMPLAIKSCFVQDHLQGFMYVEAYKEAHVMEAIRGLRNVLISRGAKLVPLSEMVQAITVNTKAKKVVDVDSWVRMRRFPHQGDPAKVLDVDTGAQRALLQFIPRIDYAEMGQRMSAAGVNEDGTDRRKAPKKPNIRPPARAFSKQEAERHGLQPYSKSNFGRRVTLPSGGEFEDGYELKWVSMRNMVLDEIGPTVEEMTRYHQVAIAAKKQGRSEAGGLEDNADLISALVGDESVVFAEGDKVRVTEGDLAGLWGYVRTVRGDGTVEMMPQLKELTELLPFPPSQLAKTFEVGDHVKVTSGQHAGQTGMVVRAQDRVCTLISDATKQELNCFAKDLSESLDISMGLDKFGDYELHDLVVLDQQTTGIIVGVETDSCRVLTSEGTADNPRIRVCKQPDIKRKFPDSRRISAPDANGNSISVSDIVTIKEGRFKNKTGTVKYIVRGSLYLQSRDVAQHGGFICLRSRSAIVKGAKVPGMNGGIRMDPSRLLRSPAPHRIAEMASNGGAVLASPMRHGPSPNLSMGSRGGGRQAFGGRGMPMRDRILGRSITVARGPYKGYKGRVVNATETHVRMELEAQYKTVSVPRTALPMADGGVPESAAAPRRGFGAPQTPGYGAPRTPGYAAGSMTPMHAWGSRTPMHAGMTPSHAGSATPMHDSAWTANATPRHPSFEDTRSDDRYRDGNTPYTPADTPGALASTPGLDAGTPGFGYGNAGTPGLDQRTPGTVDAYSPAFGNSAATPNTGLTPALADTGLQSNVARARLYQNVLVSIPGDSGRPGKVLSVDLEGGLLVEVGSFATDQEVVLGTGRTKPLSVREVLPLQPRKGDRLRILNGNEAGNEGVLTSVAGHEGVVKLADNAIRQQEDVVVVELSSLARLA